MGLLIYKYGDYYMKEVKKRDCPMSVDCWVSYLHDIIQSQQTINLALDSTVIAVVTVLISMAIAFLMLQIFIYTICMSIIFYLVIIFLKRRSETESNAAQKILSEIINGKLQTSNQIRKKWIETKGK